MTEKTRAEKLTDKKVYAEKLQEFNELLEKFNDELAEFADTIQGDDRQQYKLIMRIQEIERRHTHEADHNNGILNTLNLRF